MPPKGKGKRVHPTRRQAGGGTKNSNSVRNNNASTAKKQKIAKEVVHVDDAPTGGLANNEQLEIVSSMAPKRQDKQQPNDNNEDVGTNHKASRNVLSSSQDRGKQNDDEAPNMEMVMSFEGLKVVVRDGVRRHVFPTVKFLTHTRPLDFSTDKNTVCGLLVNSSYIIPGHERSWWARAAPLVRNVHTTHRNNIIKSIKNTYMRKLCCSVSCLSVSPLCLSTNIVTST